MIPRAMEGRWLEAGGISYWALVEKEQTRRERIRQYGEEMTRKMEEEEEKATKDMQSLDGLCSPCADADILCQVAFCPHCRIADSWDSLGNPLFTYWRMVIALILCPWCW